jgi:hypothetical protein
VLGNVKIRGDVTVEGDAFVKGDVQVRVRGAGPPACGARALGHARARPRSCRRAPRSCGRGRARRLLAVACRCPARRLTSGLPPSPRLRPQGKLHVGGKLCVWGSKDIQPQ